MADIVEKVVIKGDVSDVNAKLDQMESKLTGSFAKGELAAHAFEKALSGTLSFITDSVKAALDMERGLIAQRAAVEAMIPHGSRYVGILQEQAETMKRLTGIDDDVVRSMQTLAVNYGVSITAVDRYVKAAITLSNVTGNDLNQSMMALIKTQSGTIDRTLSAIPGIKKLTEAQLANGDAIQLVNDRWGSFSDLQLRGAPGNINRLKMAWEDFGKTIGTLAMKGGGGGMLADLADAMDLVMGKLSGAESAARTRAREMAEGKYSGAFTVGEVTTGLEVKGITARLLTPEAKRREKEARDRLADAQKERGAVRFAGMMSDPRYSLEEFADLEDERQKTILAMEKRKNDGLEEIAKSNAERQVSITNWAEDEKQKKQQETFELAALGMNVATGLMADAIENWATGSERSYQKILAGVIRMVGQQLLAKGTAYFLEGAAMIWTPVGPVNPSGYALMGKAGAMMAAGTAMIAGGAAWSNGQSSGSGSSSGGGGAASASMNQNRGIIADTGLGGSNRESRRITIIVDGNLSPADTGRWVQKSLDAAYREGVAT